MNPNLNLEDIRLGRVKDLSGTDLCNAFLIRANLSGADLSGADLSGANLIGADLTGVKLDGPELMQISWFERSILPARLLPWLSSHPSFGAWLSSLTVVED